MRLKEQVLTCLIQAAGRDLSGQELAENFGVTRSAIWKAVNSLRQEGYHIQSSTNKGYQLSAADVPLSPDFVRSSLDKAYQDLDIRVYQEVDSTNNEAKRLLGQGQDQTFLILAEQQTKGRGRQGRVFFSPKGTGLYMTLVIHPQADLAGVLPATTMASVAVARAIRKLTNLEPQIKWVNDLYLEGKKICGILTEAVSDCETATVQSLLLGIGVNTTTVDFPEELAQVGSALHVPDLSRNQLAAEIVNQLLPLTLHLEDHAYLEDYRRFSMVLGKSILYYIQGTAYPAQAIAIDDQGGLVIQTPEGQTKTLSSGEISLRLLGQNQPQ